MRSQSVWPRAESAVDSLHARGLESAALSDERAEEGVLIA